MKIIKGNSLAFKTFSWLKVNDTDIPIPEIETIDYKYESDETTKRNLKVFEDKSIIKYGVSQDALDLNDKYLNYYRVYETQNSESKDFGVIDIDTDDQFYQLMDCHDLIADENSTLKVVLDYFSKGEKPKFRNSVIRILAKKNSKVELFIIQRENKSSTSLESVGVYTEEGAEVKLSQFQLGTSKLYTNYQCELYGKNSKSYVDSIYFGNKNDELNIIYNMIHRGKDTVSDMMINGALKEEAYKNFKSNLEFKEGSTGARGSEEEYAILLDDSVFSISVPLMLCHEDDVEGNHAASAGKIDSKILFYIMTRGFSLQQAEALIIESKFTPTIDKLNDEKLEEEVWDSVRDIIKGDK